jgi:hypothetical protein
MVIVSPTNGTAARLQLDFEIVFMLKLLSLGLLLLSSAGAFAQGAPVLDTFTSRNGAFRFSYPDNYELLVGERILKATQGRNLGYPVCEFSTALVCVIYPIERLDNDKIEAAGFSVNAAPGVITDKDCLGWADRIARSSDEYSQPSFTIINGHGFNHFSGKRRMDGHAQSSDLYRTFYKDRCYELRVEISLSQESTAPKQASSRVQEKAVGDTAREALRLILSSVAFM